MQICQFSDYTISRQQRADNPQSEALQVAESLEFSYVNLYTADLKPREIVSSSDELLEKH